MKKLLLALVCAAGLVGLPGCGGCCKQSCDAPCDRYGAVECHDEIQPDGSVRKVCSNGQEVTVYEGAGVHASTKGKNEMRHHKNYRPVHPVVDGEEIRFCDKNIEAEITYEEAPAAKKSTRSRRPMRKEMIEEEEMMMS